MRELVHRSGAGVGVGVCRMSATEGSGSEADGEAEGDNNNEVHVGSGGSDAEEGEGEEAAEGGDGEGELDARPMREVPDWVTPTREELELRFPDVPEAPYPVLPDPRKMTKKQLKKAANQGISYGGQVCFTVVS